MDLDGDARLTKEEFIQGLLPYEPYSRFLKRAKEKSNAKNRYNAKLSMQG